MARVDEFSELVTLHEDTMLAGQTPGNGDPASPFQVALGTLAAWLAANLAMDHSVGVTVTTATHSQSVPAGKWLIGIAVQSASSQTFNGGTTAGTDNLIALGEVTGGAGPGTFGVLLFGGTSGNTVHFSNLTGTSTITFLLL